MISLVSIVSREKKVQIRVSCLEYLKHKIAATVIKCRVYRRIQFTTDGLVPSRKLESKIDVDLNRVDLMRSIAIILESQDLGV